MDGWDLLCRTRGKIFCELESKMDTHSNNNFRSTIPALLILSALINAALIAMPAMQLTFAKSSGKVTKDSGSKGDSSPKAHVSHDPSNGTPACGGCPGHPPSPTPEPTPTPKGSPPGTPPRLWSGCLMTSKEMSATTQSGPNTPDSRRKKFEDIINPNSETDIVFRAGQKISPFFKRKIEQGDDVFFDGIPAGSAVLEVRDEFENARR